jgi:membrane-bound ClpP family serine protease
VSDGDFIPNDTKVKVVYVEGNRIVVTEVRDK